MASTITNIQKAIYKNWLLPPGTPAQNLSASVLVTIKPGGEVEDVRVGRSSGQSAFDYSLLRAVKRSSPLPVPAVQYEKFKEMELFFDPTLAPPSSLKK